MTSRSIGSWRVLISRWPLSTTDLASRYDTVSDKWAQTARRFRLDAAYRDPLLTSQVAMGLTQIGPQARILDCGVGYQPVQPSFCAGFASTAFWARRPQ